MFPGHRRRVEGQIKPTNIVVVSWAVFRSWLRFSFMDLRFGTLLVPQVLSFFLVADCTACRCGLERKSLYPPVRKRGSGLAIETRPSSMCNLGGSVCSKPRGTQSTSEGAGFWSCVAYCMLFLGTACSSAVSPPTPFRPCVYRG